MARKKRGAVRMQQLGYKQITIWVNDKEAAMIRAVAAVHKEPVATFCRRALLTLVR